MVARKRGRARSHGLVSRSHPDGGSCRGDRSGQKEHRLHPGPQPPRRSTLFAQTGDLDGERAGRRGARVSFAQRSRVSGFLGVRQEARARAGFACWCIDWPGIGCVANCSPPNTPFRPTATTRPAVPRCAGFSHVLRALISCTSAMGPTFTPRCWGCRRFTNTFFVCLVLCLHHSLLLSP